MAKGELHIVANEAAAETLAELCASSVSVEVHGTIVKDGSASVLVVNDVIAQPNTSLPIAANKVVASKLVKVAGTKTATDVVIAGNIVNGPQGKALLLSDVSEVTSLPMIAADKTRAALAKLATNGKGEVSIKAKVVGKGASRHLVLDAK